MYPPPVRPALRLTSLCLLAALTAPRPAAACATAPPPNTTAQIAEESAIILWDDKSKTEHFIRRAAFQATAPDFGFLVPTPTKPELAEVGDEAFSALEEAIDPGYVTEPHYTLEPTALCAMTFLMRSKAVTASAPASAVRILDAQRVGGYNAVVLEADNAEALATWLTAHNYATRPSLSAWLEPYIAAHWKITAFKIAKDEHASAVSTSAVRMSFTAEQPFFPYREPADQREAQPANAPLPQGDRLLRVFFIGPERVAGSIGAAKAPWPGTTYYSNPIAKITRPLPLPVPAPEGAWLTVFEDRASPRPGTDDLFFARAADTSPLLPKPRVVAVEEPIPLPLDVIALFSFVIWRLVRWARKRSQAA